MGGVPTDNFSRGEDVFNGGREEAIMDPITIGVLVVLAAAEIGYSYYTKEQQTKQMEKREAKDLKRIDQNKREAKADAAFQYNVALANMRTGEVMAKREELMEKRKEIREHEHYGEPVDENFWQRSV